MGFAADRNPARTFGSPRLRARACATQFRHAICAQSRDCRIGQAGGRARIGNDAKASVGPPALLDADLADLILSTHARRNDETLRAGTPITDQDIAITRLRGSRMSALGRQAVEKIMAISGSKFLFDTNPLQLILRDALAAASHRSMSWELAALGYCAEFGKA
jgi:hypothetical protein